MSWHEKQVHKRVDAVYFKFGRRLHIVKIDRGAIIGKAVSRWAAYVKAYQFLEATQ